MVVASVLVESIAPGGVIPGGAFQEGIMGVNPSYCLDVALARLIEAKAAAVMAMRSAKALGEAAPVIAGTSLYAEASAAAAAVSAALNTMTTCVACVHGIEDRQGVGSPEVFQP